LAGSDGELANYTSCYLSVTLTDRTRPLDAMRRVREHFPYAVHMEWQPAGGAGAALNYAQRVRGRSDSEVLEAFLTDCRGAGPDAAETALLRSALETAGRAPGDAPQRGGER